MNPVLPWLIIGLRGLIRPCPRLPYCLKTDCFPLQSIDFIMPYPLATEFIDTVDKILEKE